MEDSVTLTDLEEAIAAEIFLADVKDAPGENVTVDANEIASAQEALNKVDSDQLERAKVALD